MALAFFESMAGKLVEPDGAEHLVDFDIKCETTRLRSMLRSGVARLTGVIRVRPWAESAAVEGTLRISPVRDRVIEYDLRFSDAAGTRFRLFGQKTLHWRSKLMGMTELSMELTRDGEAIAAGTLTFDLNDLPSFGTSWVGGSSVERVDLAGPSTRTADFNAPTAAPLSEAEQRLALAVGQTLIVPGEIVPPVDRETLDAAMVVLGSLAPHVQAAYRAALQTLDAVVRARFGRSFVELDEDERAQVFDRLAEWTDVQLIKVLAMPLEAAHFGRREYLDAIGAPTYENPVREPSERWMTQVLSPESMETETTLPCDVVVIGTGAGGGPVAAKLAEAGFAVAMVEEGRYYHRPDFAGSPAERLVKFWRDGGINVAVGNSAIVVPTGRMVGGSTAINSGTAFETPDHVLEEWRRAGFPDDFSPDNFQRYLQDTCREIGVKQASRPYLGSIADRVAAGAEALRADGHDLEHGPLPRNAPGCDGQGLCSVGCPTGAKRSSDVSWVPRALKAGAYCFTGMSVKRILMRGQKAVAIEARGQDMYGAPKTLRLEARAVVVACGTLESPLLLADSGIQLPRLGKGLSVHPALGALGLFDESLGEPWRAIPQSYGIEGLVDDRVRFEGFASPPALTAPTLPFYGKELTRWMERINDLGQYGFMVRDGNDGSVRRGLNGRPLILKSVTPDVLELFKRGSAMLAEIMLRGGAAEVATGITGVGTVTTVEQARAIADMKLKPRHFRSMAFHPLGTCAMGKSAREGVVGFDHRVFGTHNVYVVDGASVPTSLGVNPQVTIMAMALRAADILEARL